MALDALYATLPELACQRKCQAVCGPIQATPLERDRILHRHHRVLRNSYGQGTPCRLLTADGACAVYEDRPLICRLTGLTRETACPHGCEPERWMGEQEASDMMQTLLRMSAHG